MIVFDVIQVVTPEAAKWSSYPIGRCIATTFDSRERADAAAAEYNRCCNLRGCHYEVVEMDEEDPRRAYDADE